MDDLQIIDQALITVVDNIKKIFDYKTYTYKAANFRVQQFRLDLDLYCRDVNRLLQELPKIQYLSSQVSDLISHFDSEFSRSYFGNAPDNFKKERLNAWQSLRLVLNTFLLELGKELQELELEIEIKHEDISLNSPQVALLILYLRDTRMVSDNVPNTKVCELFGAMTGYSSEQLRKSITGKRNIERNQITQLEVNYDDLKDKLNKIIALIEEDKRKAILKKNK